MLSIKPVPGQDNEGSSSFAAQQQQQQMQQAGQAGQAAPQAPAWVPEPAAAVQQPPFQQQQSAAALGASFAASALQASAAAPQVPGPGAAPTAAQPPRQQMQAQQGQELGEEQHPLMLPVSAVAAGWAPDRAGKAPTGSGERGGFFVFCFWFGLRAGGPVCWCGAASGCPACSRLFHHMF